MSVPISRPDYSIYCFTMEHILVDYAVWMSSKDSDSYAMYDFWKANDQRPNTGTLSNKWTPCNRNVRPFKMLGDTHPMTQCHIPADTRLQQECHSIQDIQIILTTSGSVQIVVVCHKSRSAADQQIREDTTTTGPSFKLCNLKCLWT